MCEFKVYLLNGNEKKQVATGIIMARKREGKMLLVDVMGTVTSVENVNIVEANTLTQEMLLREA